MKKTIYTVLITLVACSTLNTLSARRKSSQTKSTTTSTTKQKATPPKRRRGYLRSGQITRTQPPAIPKRGLKQITPQAKKEAQANTQELRQDTQKLKDAMKKVEQAKTPEAKKDAEIAAYQQADNLLAELKEERTYMGDLVSGYSEQQITAARANVDKLTAIKKKIEEDIKKQEVALADVANKGFFTWSALPGKEKEYNALELSINKAKNNLARVQKAINSQKVIAGQAWSNAYTTLLATGIITAGALYATGGIAGLTAAPGALYSGAKTTYEGVIRTPAWLAKKAQEQGWLGWAGLTTVSIASSIAIAQARQKAANIAFGAAYNALQNAIKSNKPEDIIKEKEAALIRAQQNLENANKAYQEELAKQNPQPKPAQ